MLHVLASCAPRMRARLRALYIAARARTIVYRARYVRSTCARHMNDATSFARTRICSMVQLLLSSVAAAFRFSTPTGCRLQIRSPVPFSLQRTMEDQDMNEWSAASVKAWASEHYSEEVGDMFESKLTEYILLFKVLLH